MGASTPGLWELALTCLRLGTVAFGGPQAHLALLQETFVEQRHWIDAEQFEEGLALCEALPGPSSSQMAIYLGWKRCGLLGGLVSGLCFLLPGLLVVLALSALWRVSQNIENLRSISSVMQPVVVAVIWAFAWQLFQRRQARWQRWSAVALFALLALSQELAVTIPLGLVLLAGGLLRMAWSGSAPALALWPWMGIEDLALMATAHPHLQLLADLSDVFLRAGLLIFGGGFVIIPLLEGPVLEHGWMSSGAFLDGIAIGQLSPGPVVLTSAFIGFQAGANLAGGWFAIAAACTATAAMFLPSFGFILLAAPLIERLRTRPWVQAFREGIVTCIPAVVAVAALRLSLESLNSLGSWSGAGQWSVLLAALVLRLKWKLSPAALLMGAAAFALLLRP